MSSGCQQPANIGRGEVGRGDCMLLLDRGKPLPRSQSLAPATPTNSQPEALSNDLQVENEVSSRVSRDEAQLDGCGQQNGPASCRADLSGAALLICSELLVTSSEVRANRPGAPAVVRPRAGTKQCAFGNGNYNRYYGYRLAKGETEDPRLRVMEKRWFVNKRCMDIGCNEGHLTLAMAAKFRPSSILGIDIDQQLIRRACQALHAQRKATTKTLQSRGHQSRAAVRQAHATQESLSKVWFKQEDFLSSKVEAGSFDTISCMSVTKWIHLHGGDKTLAAFFQKIREVLVPGGYFVLEPQPWKSYKSAVRKLNAQKIPHKSLSEIEWRPEQFSAILTNEYSFKLLRTIVNPSQKAGFDRNIFWFKRS